MKQFIKDYVVKAEWRATALLLRVEALNEKDALKKAERMLKRWEGWTDCLSLKIVSSN